KLPGEPDPAGSRLPVSASSEAPGRARLSLDRDHLPAANEPVGVHGHVEGGIGIFAQSEDGFEVLIRGTVRRSLLGSVALEDARLHQGTELAGGSSRTDVGQVAVRRVAKAPTGEGQLEGRGSSEIGRAHV